MTKREWMLSFLLAAAGACAVRGVAYLTASGAWIVAGLLLAGLAWLTLGEVAPSTGSDAPREVPPHPGPEPRKVDGE